MSFYLRKYPVAPALRPYVKFYYILEGSAIWLDNHPQGSLDLVFGLDGGLKFHSETHQTGVLSRIAIVAQQERAFKIEFTPQTKIFGINFKPEGFYKILRLPLSEMINLSWDVNGLLPKSFLEFHEQIYTSHSEVELIRRVEDFLMREFFRVNAQLEPVDKLINHLRQVNGNLRVGEMADKMFVSRRTLHRLFVDRFGISPKAYTRVIRFQSAVRSFYQHSYLGWSAALHNSGYYDQNHFIKDFKQFTGKTPSAFLGDERSLSDFFLKE